MENSQLLLKAKKLYEENGRLSSSYLQRKLKITHKMAESLIKKIVPPRLQPDPNLSLEEYLQWLKSCEAVTPRPSLECTLK